MGRVMQGVVVAGAVAVLAGCGGGGGDDEVVVLAAASLADAFTEIAEAFEQERGVDVVLSTGASSALREQILEGAPADVFAAAAPEPADDLVGAGVAGEPRVFARNRLEMVVPAGNPRNVMGLADLARSDLLVGVCAVEVPCGRLARQVLDDAGVDASVDTEEPDVRAVLTKVAAGELDAGLVYVTDVRAGGDAVEGIALPADASTEYPIVLVGDGRDHALAADFVSLAIGPVGQRILREHGFGAP